MNPETAAWARRYQAALRKHLAQTPSTRQPTARNLGRKAVVLGLETLDLARIHAQTLTATIPPGISSITRQSMSEQAKHFFAETIVPIEQTHRVALKTDIRVNKLTQTLRRRTAEYSTATRHLKRNICLRQGAEKALKKSTERHALILRELHRLQQNLRDLMYTLLTTQEDERQRMSLYLNDKVAQDLIATNLQLLILKQAAGTKTTNLKKEIDNTQQLVAKKIASSAKFMGC